MSSATRTVDFESSTKNFTAFWYSFSFLGLSQEKLAFRCGSRRNYIGEIERGDKSSSLHIVFALAEALDVEASDLVRMAEGSLVEMKTPPYHGGDCQ